MEVAVVATPEVEAEWVRSGERLTALVKRPLAGNQAHSEVVDLLVSEGFGRLFAQWGVTFMGCFGPDSQPHFGVDEDQTVAGLAAIEEEKGYAAIERTRGFLLLVAGVVCLVPTFFIGAVQRMGMLAAAGCLASGWLVLDHARRRVRGAKRMYARHDAETVPPYNPEARGYLKWQLPPASSD